MPGQGSALRLGPFTRRCLAIEREGDRDARAAASIRVVRASARLPDLTAASRAAIEPVV